MRPTMDSQAKCITFTIHENDMTRLLFVNKYSADDISMFAALGCSVYEESIKHHIGNQSEYIEDIVQNRIKTMQQALFQLQTENVKIIDQLTTKHNIDIEKIKNEYSLKYEVALARKDAELGSMGSSLDNLKAQYAKIQQDMHEGIYNKLREELQKKEIEIKMLKGTNAVKGVIGESKIMDHLRRCFVDAEVESTRNISHECDIHMNTNDGCNVVFESKYKMSIDKNDVKKFESDIDGMRDTVNGGMFVSILSSNIPNKGDMKLELKKHEIKYDGKKVHRIIPMMYIGFKNEECFDTMFPYYAKTFMTICSSFKSVINEPCTDDAKLSDYIGDIGFYFNLLIDNVKRIDEFKAKFSKFIIEIEKNNLDLLSRIESFIKKHNLTIKRHDNKNQNGGGNCEGGNGGGRKQKYKCEKCEEMFSNKKLHGQHILQCMKP